jgi:hypothetical protein
MAQARRLLAPLTAIWLCCQVGTVTFVPVVLWVHGLDPHAAECTCGHGADATCPMHHKSTDRSSTRCAMQSANSSGAAVLTTLVGIAGVVAPSTPSIQLPIPSVSARTADADVRGRRPVPPDPPPPRV